MLIRIILIVLLLLSFHSTAQPALDPNFAFKQEALGLKHYQDGNYKAAFNELNELAAWGYKDSQYILAFMFLKGQYVQQSTLIGMGWLALAAESGIKEWVTLFDNLYVAANKEQQLRFDKIITDYKAKFGMKAQRVTCRKTQKAPSKKVVIACTKGDYFIKKHVIDLAEPVL